MFLYNSFVEVHFICRSWLNKQICVILQQFGLAFENNNRKVK